MHVKLNRIAESKVRQLGGDVCGVLVRSEDPLDEGFYPFEQERGKTLEESDDDLMIEP